MLFENVSSLEAFLLAVLGAIAWEFSGKITKWLRRLKENDNEK